MKIKERIYHSEQNSEPCPYCSNRVVLPEFNSFKALNKDLMKEWNSINNYLITDPDIILPTNNTYLIYWTCENNHTYKMSPKSRTLYKKRNQTACPICKGLRQPKAHYF